MEKVINWVKANKKKVIAAIMGLIIAYKPELADPIIEAAQIIVDSATEAPTGE